MKRVKVFVLVALLLIAVIATVSVVVVKNKQQDDLNSSTNVTGEIFMVAFESNGGSAVDSLVGIAKGNKIVKPASPTKPSFSFVGWYKDAALLTEYIFEKDVVNTNFTLYAKWEAAHVHTFSEWVITTPATCTTAGEKTKTCACGDKVTEIIPAIGGEHIYGALTETETGLTKECTKCHHNEVVPYTAGLVYVDVDVDGTMVHMVRGIGTASGAVYIPKTHDGKTVGGIAQSAFQGCPSLTSVTIPSSVTIIRDWAFHSCRLLSTIIIPSSVISIGDRAFQSCIALAAITIPSSVTSIGNYVFYGCTALAAINIPSSVTKIGGEAFHGCTSLASVTIPSSVTSIGGDAFNGCTSLASIAADPANANYHSIEGNLYNKAGTTLIRYAPGKTATSFSIPSSVTSIGDRAFRGCTSLASVTIPSSVTSIGDGAFWGCTALAAINIPSSVTSIGIEGSLNRRGAFDGCTNLATVTFEAGSKLATIGNEAFVYCTSLVAINIPSSVTSIEEKAFRGCTNLATVTFEAGSKLASIGNSAFSGCPSLASITLPSSVTSIEKGAFAYCTALASITIPSSVTSMGGDAFSGGVFNDCTNLATVTFEEESKLASIADGAFSGCTALASITLPSSVTSIGGRAFYGCIALVSVTIPSSVTKIISGAFDGCTALASITLPSSVTRIEWNAFGGCTALTIYAEAKEKPTNWDSDWNRSRCPMYWFSATAPTGTPATGNGYWHDVGGVPTKW